MYVGVPPLYKLDLGRGQSRYCYTDAELAAATASLAPGSFHVQRFKVCGACWRACAVHEWAGCSPHPRLLVRPQLHALPDAAPVLLNLVLPTHRPGQGLGEMMPEQLWQTTLNPETRTLRKLTIEDAGGLLGAAAGVRRVRVRVPRPLRLSPAICLPCWRLHAERPAAGAQRHSRPAAPPACPGPAAEASHMFALLMGDKVAPRRELIERHGSRLALEELDI